MNYRAVFTASVSIEADTIEQAHESVNAMLQCKEDDDPQLAKPLTFDCVTFIGIHPSDGDLDEVVDDSDPLRLIRIYPSDDTL